MKTKKKIWCCLFSLLWMFVLIFPVMASEIPEERQKPLLVDEVGLLTEEESSALLNKLEDISRRYENEVGIVTVNSLEGKTAEAYADDYYDYNGYGIDSEKSGVLFLVSKGDRKYHISTTGAAIKAFTDYGIECIKDEIKPYLSDGEYFDASDKFLDMSIDFVHAYKDGKPYDTDNPYMEKADYVILEIIAFVIALVIAGISVAIMRFRMNTAKPKKTATEYIKKDSFRLTSEKDIFMYSSVTKTAKPKDDGVSSGGSTTHTSSSGSTHGGGGGSF